MMTKPGATATNNPRVVHDPLEMHGLVRQLHGTGKRIGMVPTMGGTA